MTKDQLILAVKRLKTKFPSKWFDKAIEQFGFNRVVVLLDKIN